MMSARNLNDDINANASIPYPTLIESQDPQFFALRRLMIRVWLSLSIISVVAWYVLGMIALLLAIIAFGGLIISLLLHLYHKQQIENFQHYRQTESLFALYNLLDIRHPLPPLRLWAASADFGVLVISTILEHKSMAIIELGSGTSTVLSGYALEGNKRGQIISFDHDASFASHSRVMIEQHNLSKICEVVMSPLKPVAVHGKQMLWYDYTKFQELNSIDLLIVDGPPNDSGVMTRYPALPLLYDKLAPGAIIIIDDFRRNEEYQMVAKWVAEFDLEFLRAIPNEKGAAILQKREPRLSDQMKKD